MDTHEHEFWDSCTGGGGGPALDNWLARFECVGAGFSLESPVVGSDWTMDGVLVNGPVIDGFHRWLVVGA